MRKNFKESKEKSVKLQSMCDALCFFLLRIKKKGPCLAFLFPWVIIEGDSGRVSTWNCCCFRALGAFNNYVDKKRWVDIQKVHARSSWTKGIELCKMSTIVHICLAHFIFFLNFGHFSCVIFFTMCSVCLFLKFLSCPSCLVVVYSVKK